MLMKGRQSMAINDIGMSVTVLCCDIIDVIRVLFLLFSCLWWKEKKVVRASSSERSAAEDPSPTGPDKKVLYNQPNKHH